MVSKKPSKTKKEEIKVVLEPIVEEVVEEPVVEKKAEVRSYLVPILFQREPVNKDIPVADLFYRKDANLIELQCHAPNHEASLEMIVQGDISVETSTGAVTMVSKSESPIAWITSLHKSKEFSGNPFIAKEAQELNEA